MSNLYRPGRNLWQPARGSQRPLWPFTVNRDSLQADGLVAWWPFAPPGGDILFDLSGRGNHGTLTNMAPESDWVANELFGGLALDFNGVDAVVSIASPIAIDNIFAGGGGTITAWIKPRTIGESFGRIIDRASTELSADGYSFLTQTPANPRIRFTRGWTGGIAGWNAPTDSITLNVWQHVAVTYDEGSTANDPAMYVNAISQSISETDGVPSGSPESDAAEDLTIGNYTATTRTFDGLIDDVRLYDRILTSQEIKLVFNQSTRWDLYYPLRQQILLSALVAGLTGGSGNSPIFRVKHSPWGYM